MTRSMSTWWSKWLPRSFRRRLQNVGLSSKHSHILADYCFVQIQHQGGINTLKHLKEFGCQIQHYLDPSLPQGTWVGKRSRLPRKFIWLGEYSRDTLVIVSKVFRFITFPVIIEEQIQKKIVPIITSKSDVDVSALTNYVRTGMRQLGRHSFPEYSFKLVAKMWKRYSSVSGPDDDDCKTPQFGDALNILAHVPVLRTIPGYHKVMAPLQKDCVEQIIRDIEPAEPSAYDEIIGVCFAQQEPGGKLRTYAAPYTVYQGLLNPVSNHLSSILDGVVTDCRRDQSEGKRFAMAAHARGEKVFSLDLSSATDTFPLLPQLEMLSWLEVPDEHLNVLAHVCRGRWRLSFDEMTPRASKLLKTLCPDGTISWSTGQPLGIRPSFLMFSLAHNALLNGICQHYMLDPEHTFRVLGDDVIVSDQRVADEYTRVLGLAGVKCDSTKSHGSANTSEFAGAFIEKDWWLNPGKYKPLDYSNYLGVSESLSSDLSWEVSKTRALSLRVNLFRIGAYSPTVDLWPHYMRAEYVTRSIPLGLPKVPTIFDACPGICRQQIDSLYGDRNVRPYLRFYKPYNDLSRPVWDVVSSYTRLVRGLDILERRVDWTLFAAETQEYSLRLSSIQRNNARVVEIHFDLAMVVIDQLYNTNCISEGDYYVALRQLKRAAHSALFITERNEYKEEEQRSVKLIKRYGALLKREGLSDLLVNDVMHARTKVANLEMVRPRFVSAAV